MHDRLKARDVSLLDSIESQTSDNDKRSLLALHHMTRERHGRFAYLEIGSHLGGSLQSFIADPQCETIVSIDPRPLSQPDERLGGQERYHYPRNSTTRMIELLGAVPGADIRKLRTIEAGTDQLRTDDVDVRPHLCFIDGEHTVAAVLRDAQFCERVLHARGLIAFHDRSIVLAAICQVVAGSGLTGYPLRDDLFVVSNARDALQELSDVIPFRRLWRVANRLGVASQLLRAERLSSRLRTRLAIRARLKSILRT